MKVLTPAEFRLQSDQHSMILTLVRMLVCIEPPKDIPLPLLEAIKQLDSAGEEHSARFIALAKWICEREISLCSSHEVLRARLAGTEASLKHAEDEAEALKTRAEVAEAELKLKKAAADMRADMYGDNGNG